MGGSRLGVAAVFLVAACGSPAATQISAVSPLPTTATIPSPTAAPTAPPPTAPPTTIAPTAPTGPRCATAPGGMVAWWRADNDATDAAGSNDGTLQGGATFDAGTVGKAFAFDGNAQFVEVPNNSALQLTSGLTIEGWVFAAGTPAGYAGIAGTWDDFEGANRTYLFWVYGGRLEVVLSFDGGSYGRATDAEPFPADAWVHVAATFDGETIRLYRDGTEVATAPFPGKLFTNSRSFTIGRTFGGSVGANDWKGSIDELSVYDHALGADEIAAIHAAGSAGKCPG